jgi:hypothetical protein
VTYRPIYIDSAPNELSATLSAMPAGPVYRLVAGQ